MLSNAELEQEIQAQTAARTKASSSFDVHKHCFTKQRPFVLSRARQRTACCSRRAGKSEGCAAVLISTALDRPGCVGLYLTKTKLSAKRILWGVLCRVVRDYRLDATPKESELSIVFGSGSIIYLAGANNRDEIEKFRGMPIGVVVLDEAQILAGYLQQLVDEVLAPALMDYDGSLVLVGTPAPVPAGYFYECHNSPAWEHFEWTFFDNPHIHLKSGKTPRQHLKAECERRGVTEEDASIQREFFGRWAYDPNALVFRFDATRNVCTTLPDVAWEYVLGVDLGFDDADAIAVLGWHDGSPNLYLMDEWVGAKQGITPLAERLTAMEARYKPTAIVVDTGGLGKKIAEEITMRTGLALEAADKVRKLEHIELLNDALRTGRFLAQSSSRFAQDCLLVEWDKSKPEKPKISERYHSDICDAVLYAFRKAYHWTHTEAAPTPPQHGSPEWHQRQAERVLAEEARMEEEALRETAERQREREEAENECDWY